MRYPEFLSSNSSIGFPAPSFGCTIEPYHTAFLHMLDVMKERGHLLYPGDNAFKDDGVGISTDPENCGRELTAMYLDRDIDALISCGGGELMCEILDYVDFEKIKAANPKWFLGYSDNTNFVFPLVTICDVAAIYGPCAASFGMEPWHESIRNFYDLLLGRKNSFDAYDKWESTALKDAEHPLETINATEKRIHAIYKDGTFIQNASLSDISLTMEGRMIGGCMDCLVNLLGTEYDKVTEFDEKYKEDGIIWVLEACDLNVFSIRRAMWQMEHAGWFKHVKGFIFGRPLNPDEMMGLNRFDAVLSVAAKYNVPVIMDADVGHVPPSIPIVMGAFGKVSVHGNDMNITYDFR